MSGTAKALALPARLVVLAAAVAGVTKVFGFDARHAILLGLGTLLVSFVCVVVARGGASARWLPDKHAETDGSRLEVAALSWSLLGRGGRVSEGALRRIRAVAQGRLARHGLSLERPEDHLAIERLLGPAAWHVLTTTYDMPSRRAYEQCVQALERALPDPR